MFFTSGQHSGAVVLADSSEGCLRPGNRQLSSKTKDEIKERKRKKCKSKYKYSQSRTPY